MRLKPGELLIIYLSEKDAAMSLWVDKYRPTSLNKLDYHKEQASRLKKLVS